MFAFCFMMTASFLSFILYNFPRKTKTNPKTKPNKPGTKALDSRRLGDATVPAAAAAAATEGAMAAEAMQPVPATPAAAAAVPSTVFAPQSISALPRHLNMPVKHPRRSYCSLTYLNALDVPSPETQGKRRRTEGGTSH